MKTPEIGSASVGGFVLNGNVNTQTVGVRNVSVATIRRLGSAEWRGKIYPDGELSFCRQKKFKLEAFSGAYYDSEQKEWIQRMVRMHGVSETIRVCSELGSAEKVPMGKRKVGGRLDLTSDSNSEKTPHGYRGITSRGRRTVRNAVYLLEKDYGKDRLSFLTLTLPPVDIEKQKVISSNWGRIVEHVVKAIRYRLYQEGLPSLICGVTEIQEERQRSLGGCPLHLHFVFVGRHKRKGWAVKPGQIRKSWKDAINNCFPERLRDVSFSTSENIQRVRKSAYRYIAKYLTKGVGTLDKVREDCPGIQLPKQWYTCSQELVKRIYSEIKVPDIHALELLIYAVKIKDRDIVMCPYEKFLKSKDGRDYLIAGRAWLTEYAKNIVETFKKH